MNRATALPLAMAGVGLLTALLFALNVDSPLRAVVSVAFLLLGPGLAIVRLFRFRQPLTVFTLAVAVSLGVETVVATMLLATGTWTPGRALAVVVSLTVVAVTFDITRKGGGPLRSFQGAQPPPLSTTTSERN